MCEGGALPRERSASMLRHGVVVEKTAAADGEEPWFRKSGKGMSCIAVFAVSLPQALAVSPPLVFGVRSSVSLPQALAVSLPLGSGLPTADVSNGCYSGLPTALFSPFARDLVNMWLTIG